MSYNACKINQSEKLLENVGSYKIFLGVGFQECFKSDRNILGCGGKNILSRVEKMLGWGDKTVYRWGGRKLSAVL